jgi:site-specific recombinase XerD
MGQYVDGFQAWLLGQGYTPGTVEQVLKYARQFGRWMVGAGLEPSQLDKSVVDVFLSSRGARRTHGVGARNLGHLLDYLRSEGVLKPEIPLVTPVGEIVARYRSWLVDERGLASQTILRYERTARRFLQRRETAVGIRFVEDLAGTDVISFLLEESSRASVGAAKGLVAELRSLLRYLYLQKLTPMSLATVVPPVAGWHDTSVPVGATAADVQRLLDACNRNDPGGIRDYAVLMLVARLGLRSVEVARLELGDIDWRAGEIAVRGKARRRDRLPLPWDVGEALSEYLSGIRPSTPIRQVFLTAKAPRHAILPALVGQVTRRACERAGVSPFGAHRLRHALATEMLRQGATIVQVSQVLRHRDLATTAIYAKVDFGTLRQVAQPWPGAER